MALLKRLRNLRSETNTGFSTNSNSTGGRFINKNGQPNVIKKGVGLLDRYSWYHTMLGLKTSKFLFLIFLIYILVNFVFAGIYYMIGTNHLTIDQNSSPFHKFSEVFFFSAQTFTTVGYGRIAPVGFAASAVSTFEAFLGLLSFAIATGLFYGRFARPQAFVAFSKNALIAPFRGGTALMFRLAPYKNNTLAEVEVKVTLAVTTEDNGKLTDKFYDLELEYSKITGLSLSWTIVHPIDDKSPFYGLSPDEIAATDMEIMVFLKAFDSVFSNNVVTRTSYISSEIVWGAKFNMMFRPNEDKSKTILEVDKLNDFDKAELPQQTAIAAV